MSPRCLHVSPGKNARAERGLKVVAADGSVEIQNLAREIKAGDEFAFHRATVDLRQRQSARGDFGLSKAAGSSD